MTGAQMPKRNKKIEKLSYEFGWHKDGPVDIHGNYPWIYKGPGSAHDIPIIEKINEIIDFVNKVKGKK